MWYWGICFCVPVSNKSAVSKLSNILYCRTLKKIVGLYTTKGVECWHTVWCYFTTFHVAYSCLHSSTVGAFQLEVVWLPSLHPWSLSYYPLFTFGCCILLRIYPARFPMMPSIATKFQYINSPLYFFPLTTCFGPYRPSSGGIYNWCLQGLFLLQRIRCTYTTWRMSMVHSPWILTFFLHFLFYIWDQSQCILMFFTTFILCLITCIGDHGSKYHRHTSSCVRTTDPL
jgi:hypothetical protein